MLILLFKCFSDADCGDGKFCSQHYCELCFPCSLKNRHDGDKCARDEDGCGECFDGYETFFSFSIFLVFNFFSCFRFKRDMLTSGRFSCEQIPTQHLLKPKLIDFMRNLVNHNKKQMRFNKNQLINQEKLDLERDAILRSLLRKIGKQPRRSTETEHQNWVCNHSCRHC